MIYSQVVSKTAGAVRYIDCFGIYGLQTSEASVRTPIAENIAKKLFVRVTANTLNDSGLGGQAPTTVRLRVNGVNSALSISIIGTGVFVDTDDVSINDMDEISLLIDTTTNDSGSITLYVGVCFLSQ